MNIDGKKIIVGLLLILAALLSFLFLADKASSPETYTSIIESIDGKTEDVMKLTSTSTLLSVGISAIPDDTATPIANKLADFSQYFMLILCVLYTEKYMLTVAGAVAFKWLIPIACGLGIVYLCEFKFLPDLRKLAVKLAVFAVILVIAVPVSIRLSDMVYDTYSSSIDNTIASAEKLTEEIDALNDETGSSGAKGLINRISEKAEALLDKAASKLTGFVEAIAVMIVTSCIIPILGILLLLWLVKLFTGADTVQLPLPAKRREEQRPDREN